MKCEHQDGEEAFILRSKTNEVICYSKSECEGEGMIANKENFSCEEDENHPGSQSISDDERYKSGEKQLIKDDLHLVDFGNTLESELGKPTINRDEAAVELKNHYDQEANEYKQQHNESPNPGNIKTALLQIKTNLMQGLKIAASEEENVGIAVVDDLCAVYNAAWVNNNAAQKFVGGILFGYKEGRDPQLQEKLDESKSFKEMYDVSIAAVDDHSKGIGKKLADYIDEEKSGERTDSIWCQSMALVEGLEAKIDSDSNVRLFLAIAEKVVLLMKKFAKQGILKIIVDLIGDVINWVEKQRNKWDKKLKKLQNLKGYRVGVSRMCDFSTKFRKCE